MLVKSTLVAELVGIFTEAETLAETTPMTNAQYADKLATAIDNYIKTATVNTNVSTTVSTAVVATATAVMVGPGTAPVAGAGSGSGTGTGTGYLT